MFTLQAHGARALAGGVIACALSVLTLAPASPAAVRDSSGSASVPATAASVSTATLGTSLIGSRVRITGVDYLGPHRLRVSGAVACPRRFANLPEAQGELRIKVEQARGTVNAESRWSFHSRVPCTGELEAFVTESVPRGEVGFRPGTASVTAVARVWYVDPAYEFVSRRYEKLTGQLSVDDDLPQLSSLPVSGGGLTVRDLSYAGSGRIVVRGALTCPAEFVESGLRDLSWVHLTLGVIQERGAHFAGNALGASFTRYLTPTDWNPDVKQWCTGEPERIRLTVADRRGVSYTSGIPAVIFGSWSVSYCWSEGEDPCYSRFGGELDRFVVPVD